MGIQIGLVDGNNGPLTVLTKRTRGDPANKSISYPESSGSLASG